MKPPLIDPFGRSITYLRVSVTDRCDLRCVYCMSERMRFLPRTELLSLEELDRVCAAFIARGVRKLRFTGGEPLVRKGLLDLLTEVSRHLRSGDLDEMLITTNGVQLAEFAEPLGARWRQTHQRLARHAGPRDIRAHLAARSTAASSGGDRSGCRPPATKSRSTRWRSSATTPMRSPI